MKKYAFTLGVLIALFAIFHFTSGGGASSPQQFTMKAGSTTKVGGGKASMWFAQPTDVYANGRINTAAMVSLTCDGQESGLTLVKGEAPQSACGVRVSVLEVREPDETSKVFRGTFKVEWP
ncbi:MAG: hypothetical protein JNK75_01260 [Betaproteobacteria bacterium]|nr:hypothetical protein [Betaproteobacteria bacterium]